MKNKNYDLVIIGGGSAGIGAALSAFESGVTSILIVEREGELGGILNQCIHEGFGLHLFKKELTGPEYAHLLTKLLNDKNIECVFKANVVDISSDKVLQIFAEDVGLLLIKAKAIILTTGSFERSAGAINLPGDRSAGIFTAGQAQYLINKKGYVLGDNVFIVGSGDIGLIMARRLVLTGANVLGVSEIMPHSSGLTRNLVQCLEDFNIPLYLSHKVVSVRGKPRVNEVDICQIDDNFKEIKGTIKTFKIDTLLLAVGLIPLATLAEKLQIPLTKSRGPFVNNYYQTAVPWLFVAGNALHIHDLADEAYLEGQEAGHAVALFLAKQLNTTDTIDVVVGNGLNYVIPNQILYPVLTTTLILKFRVQKPFENKRIKMLLNDEVIFQKFYPFLLPSELLSVSVKSESITKPGILKVEVSND